MASTQADQAARGSGSLSALRNVSDSTSDLHAAPSATPSSSKTAGPCRGVVPSDVQREIDLIEEVARTTGYDRIPALRLAAPEVVPLPSAAERALCRLRAALSGAGYDEARTPTFVGANGRPCGTLRVSAMRGSYTGPSTADKPSPCTRRRRPSEVGAHSCSGDCSSGPYGSRRRSRSRRCSACSCTR